MKKIVMLMLVGALILTAGLVSAAQSEIWGRVESVDGNVINVSNGRDGEFTIQVDSETKIEINGESSGIDDIVIPSNIKGTVEEITDSSFRGIELIVTSNENCPVGSTPGSFVGGRVTSIDSENRSFEMYSGRLGSFTVKLSDDALLTKDDQEIDVSDVEVNDMIRFEASEQADGTYIASSGIVNDSNCGGSRGGRGGRGRGCNR